MKRWTAATNCVKRGTYVAIALAIAVTPSVSKADLMLTLSPGATPQTVNYNASGSVTVSLGAGGIGTSQGALPIGGSWDPGFDDDIGDIFTGIHSSFENDGLQLSGNGIQYIVNSVPVTDGRLTEVTLGVGAGDADDLRLRRFNQINYPTLSNGDTLSWSGSGSFLLDSRTPNLPTGTLDTFAQVFNTGTFMRAIDGGNFVLHITSSVPEPSAALFMLVAGAMVGVAGGRRSRER